MPLPPFSSLPAPPVPLTPVWALEELNLEYSVKTYLRTPSRTAPPSLREVSPFGKAPVLELDGEVITESAYIIHRLLEIAPPGIDVETTPSNDSIFWAHFAEGSQMNLFQAGAVIGSTASAWAGGKVDGVSEEERKGIAKYAGWLDQGYLKPQNQTNLDQVSLLRQSGVAQADGRLRRSCRNDPESTFPVATSPVSVT